MATCSPMVGSLADFWWSTFQFWIAPVFFERWRVELGVENSGSGFQNCPQEILTVLVDWLSDSLISSIKCRLLCPLDDRQFDLILEILRQSISSGLSIHPTIMKSLTILQSWLMPSATFSRSVALAKTKGCYARPLPFADAASVQHNKRFIVELVICVFFLTPANEEEAAIHSRVCRKVVDMYRLTVDEVEFDPVTW